MLTIHAQIVCVFVLVFNEESSSSIAGLTYMDNFDFEKRYRNENECDPAYWHPLHFPDHCLDFYERLIRTRMGLRNSRSRLPFRQGHSRRCYYKHNRKICPRKTYQKRYRHSGSDEYDSLSHEWHSGYDGNPHYDAMRQMKLDIKKNPRGAELTLTKFGLAAVYHQPVSKMTENLIRKMGNQYAVKPYNDPNIFWSVKSDESDKESTGNSKETKATSAETKPSSTETKQMKAVLNFMNNKKTQRSKQNAEHKFIKKNIKNGMAYIVKSH